MQPQRKTASPILAAFWFWLVPTLAVPAFGPMDKFADTLFLIGVLSIANALGFLAAEFLCPRIQRQHAVRLFALSGAVGLTCYFAFPVVVRLVRPWGHLEFWDIGDVELPALALGAVLLSGLIGFVSLRVALALRFLLSSELSSICGKCGYDLRASPGPKCPECGARVSAPRDA